MESRNNGKKVSRNAGGRVNGAAPRNSSPNNSPSNNAQRRAPEKRPVSQPKSAPKRNDTAQARRTAPVKAPLNTASSSKRPSASNTTVRQSPSAKKTQTVKKTVKRPLTPEQKARLEARRRAAEAARKRMLKRLGTVLILFLTCYVTVSLIAAGIIWANFTHVSAEAIYPIKIYQPKKNPENDKEREKLLATCSAEAANIDGGLYISYTALTALSDVSAVGDRDKLTVVFRDGNDILECTAFSNTIYINGVPASLTFPVMMSGNEYYFPMEILNKYASGVVVTTAEDRDGNPFCKVMLAKYGGELRLNNHSDSGSFSVSEPEQGFEPSSEPVPDESSQE